MIEVVDTQEVNRVFRKTLPGIFKNKCCLNYIVIFNVVRYIYKLNGALPTQNCTFNNGAVVILASKVGCESNNWHFEVRFTNYKVRSNTRKLAAKIRNFIAKITFNHLDDRF